MAWWTDFPSRSSSYPAGLYLGSHQFWHSQSSQTLPTLILRQGILHQPETFPRSPVFELIPPACKYFDSHSLCLSGLGSTLRSLSCQVALLYVGTSIHDRRRLVTNEDHS